jgi:NADH-quinone oxidoreductase subunit L
LGTHGALQIPLLEAQGAVIFLFFIWITSSQAILTLTRLRAVASWKVSAAMLLTLLFVVFVYLFAVESFTAFLYPNAEEVAAYFKAAELPSRLFDMMIGAATLTTIIGWVYVYVRAHGRTLPMPTWINGIRIRLYVLFLNRLYLDEVLDRLDRAQLAAIRRFDEPVQGRTP